MSNDPVPHDPTSPPPLGRLERLRSTITAINLRIFTASAGIYVAAGSFVGFEALAFLLGFAPLWPIAIPLAIAGIAAAGLIARRMRGRRGEHPRA